MSAARGISAGSYVTAGQSAWDNTIGTIRAARRNAPDHTSLAVEGIRQGAAKQAAGITAASKVAEAGIRAESAYRQNKSDIEVQKELTEARQDVRKTGRLAAAGIFALDTITDGKRAKAEYNLKERHFNELVEKFNELNAAAKARGVSDKAAKQSEIANLHRDPNHSPEQSALLDTVSWSEGTWTNGKRDYGVQFGGGKFDNSKPHPSVVVGANDMFSSAAGAYQFTPSTWKLVNSGTNVSMTSQNQDAGALQLIKNSNYDYTKPFADQYHKLAPSWASIPTLEGQSYWDKGGKRLGTTSRGTQPTKNAEEMIKFYLQRLSLYQNN